jgi:hypothetical protein
MTDWDQVTPIFQGIISECNTLSDSVTSRSKIYSTCNMIVQLVTISGSAITSVTNSLNTFQVVNIVILIIVAILNSIQTVFDLPNKVNINNAAYMDFLDLSTDINSQLALKPNLRKDPYQYLSDIERKKLVILRSLGYQNLSQQVITNLNSTSTSKPLDSISIPVNALTSQIKLSSVNIDREEKESIKDKKEVISVVIHHVKKM